MIHKISLFLAKFLVIITLVSLGSVLILPSQTQAATTDADYAHLTFYALDANQQPLTKVSFSIYEQLTDIAGQPVLGTRLGYGYIDSTGIDTIKIKNVDKKDYNVAILYYKNSRNYEKFTQWNEHIYGTSDQTFYLTFSSAKIVVKDKNNNLLKNQAFNIYSTGIDAQDKIVTYEKLYSNQKTGALGYKVYNFVPGQYAVKIAGSDYFFTITKNQETLVDVIYNPPVKGTTNVQTKATLNFYAKDPQGQGMTKVYYKVYEQLKDINNKPVLGTKLGSGYIDYSGLDTILIKNSADNTINIAVEYYLHSRNFEKFVLWNQQIKGIDNQTYILPFSSAKIVIRDSKQNLLTTQLFYIYSGGLNANGEKVADQKLYSSQKTGALGYKTYYFVPGDYVVKISESEYLFTINKNQETLVNVTYDPPAKYTPAGKITATLNLISKNPQGLIVSKVGYGVYEQQEDANHNPVLGKKLASGTIGETGQKTVTLKNSSNNTLNLAIVYYQLNNEYGKFYLYNQTLTGAEVKTVNLPFSGAKISINEPSGSIMKNYSFDLYAILKNANGSQIGTKKVLSSQKTGDIGTKTLYLIPGDYFITVKYLNATDPETSGSTFRVNNSQMTDFRYGLGAVKVSFNFASGSDKTSFKILKYRDGSYYSIGSYTTDDGGTKRVVLPAGEYQLDSKLSQEFQFIIVAGNERSFTFTQGTFTFRVVNGYHQPLPGLKVTVYKYTNSKQGRVFAETTNYNGDITKPLDTGNYIAEIDTLINGQKYTSKVFYVQNTYGATYEFVVSMVRVYLQDNRNNNLANQDFYLYNYATDTNGNVIPGKEMGKYTTNHLGYYDINLLAGRYIIKPVNATKIFPISVEAEKLNAYYLTAVINPDYVQPTPPVAAQPTKTINTPSSNTVYMASIYTNNNLYDKDTDGDTLTDFEETYIWLTDPQKADTDGDGYPDNVEIANGYDPLGSGRKYYVIWGYDKPRVSDLRIEQKEASYLQAEITRRLGYVPNVSDTNWNTLIKAFVYGGYTVAEIQNTIQYGPGLVHPTIPAYKWRFMR